jgi:hypothetical protein
MEQHFNIVVKVDLFFRGNGLSMGTFLYVEGCVMRIKREGERERGIEVNNPSQTSDHLRAPTLIQYNKSK